MAQTNAQRSAAAKKAAATRKRKCDEASREAGWPAGQVVGWDYGQELV